MAAEPWTCENCGAVNASDAGVCVVCEAPAPQRRGRSRALWILATLMLVAVAAIGTTLLLAARHHPSATSPSGPFPSYTTPVIPPSTTASPPAAVAPSTTTVSTTTTTSPTGKPCPDNVAQTLPGGGPATALLAAQTERSVVTICQTGDGQIFYHGQSRGSAGDITLPAQPEGDGFFAVNGNYRYTVGGGRLVVTSDGETLSDETLTPVG